MRAQLRNLSMWLLANLCFFGFTSCTDPRPTAKSLVSLPPGETPSVVPKVNVPPPKPKILTPIVTVKYRNQNMTTFQLALSGSQLFLTGLIFGFSGWNVSDPENPVQQFEVNRTEQLLDGYWSPSLYASGALGIFGSQAIMSGTAGLSVIDLSLLREVQRLPGSLSSDPKFVYKAMLKHPSLPLMYGFSERDFVYYLEGQVPNLRLRSEVDEYGGNNCCVRGASHFSDKVFLAFQKALWILGVDSSGLFSEVFVSQELQAHGVFSTGRFLYVHHVQMPLIPSPYPTGVYVFDPEGRNVAYFNVNPNQFVIYQDSYLITKSDTSVEIYRLFE